MNLAYFITPPLIIEPADDGPNSLLDPEFPPEIVNLLRGPLVAYLSRKYSKHKRAFDSLPEDLIILLGEMELVLANQLVFLKNIANDDSADKLPLPHVVQDIFYYLTHEDIIALVDMVDIMTAQAHYFLDEYFNIILEKDKASSFIRDTISKSFAMFILNMCDDCKYVYRMIDQYPYLFLWKPVLMSFIKIIDQLAHLKYLEFGKIPEISYILRKSLNSDKYKDPFGELLKKCKRLTLFALISNHSNFKLILKTVEMENKNTQLFRVNLESNVHNFTIELIKKWISEYSPTKDEYRLKIDMILKDGEEPMKISDKTVDSFFLSDITSTAFLEDPLTVLSFDHSSAVPYMKSIHYFIELTRNMLSFEENKTKSLEDLDKRNVHNSLEQSKEKGSGSKLAQRSINISFMTNEI